MIVNISGCYFYFKEIEKASSLIKNPKKANLRAFIRINDILEDYGKSI